MCAAQSAREQERLQPQPLLKRESLQIGDAETQHEVGLIETREHVQSGAFRGAGDGRHVDVRGDVGFAGMLQKIGELRMLFVGCQRAGRVGGAVQLALVMAVVNERDESAAQRFGCGLRPVFCGQIHFGAPADAHLRAGAREVFGDAWSRKLFEALDETPVHEIYENFPKPGVGHHNRVRRQRIEELVRINDAVNVFWKRGCAVRKQGRVRPERLDLGGARDRRLFDERKANSGVELGVGSLRCVQHITGQTAGASAGLDQVERWGLGTGDLGLCLNQHAPHFGELLSQQLTEDGADVDAGKKIARTSGLLGRAGVVAEFRMVERDLHELREADGAARPDAIGYQLAESIHYPLRTVTNCSWPRRMMSMPTARPDGTVRSTALASVMLVTALRFT